MRTLPLLRLGLVERRGRLLALVGLALLFLAAGASVAAMARGGQGGVGLDTLYQLGGYPLVSAVLLTGWVLGRFPLVATVVLFAGVVSADRESGQARLLAVRPVSPLWIYGGRALGLGLAAFVLGAVLLPLFDLLLLSTWAGTATLVLVAAYVMVYGSLTLLLSTWTRWDGWLAALLAIAAMIWHTLLRAGGGGDIPIGARQFLTIILPPQGALFALEGAFADLQPIPWESFGYAAGYAAILVVLAGITIWRREI